MAKLLEPDLSTRMLRITSGFNDVLYSVANEPSLGMYRIQEHIAVTVPRLVEQQRHLQENCQRVEGACYDLEYDTRTLRDMAGITQFSGIRNSLLQALQLKKKLDEMEVRKRTSHSLRPVASLSPIHSHPPPLTSSLPPTVVIKTTPTRINTGSDDANESTDVMTPLDEAPDDGRDPATETDIKPKTFN